MWLLREMSVIALFVLAAWAVVAPGLAGIPQLLAFIVFVAVTVALTIQTNLRALSTRTGLRPTCGPACVHSVG
jgi:Na+/H+-dicarboxylate symporter